MFWLILSILLIAGIVYLFKKLSGEDERIKTFFRVYKKAKETYPEKSEQELLEIVIEEHIPPNRTNKLKNAGISGKTYLDEVFVSQSIDLDNLVAHLIKLEFREKYPPSIDLDEIRKNNREGQLSKEEILLNRIKTIHKELYN